MPASSLENPKNPSRIVVVGAGLAGSECAFQLAERGIDVLLVEQKPTRRTPAQHMDSFAELVCSNSFRGAALSNAVGLLKEEMRQCGSLVMAVGTATRVPAGGAFAVDRDLFSQAITKILRSHPRIRVEEREVLSLDEFADVDAVVVATGPLTGDALAKDIEHAIGKEYFAYYDAIAPIIDAESIDYEKVFFASRYDKGEDDAYLNCPLDKEQYTAFVQAVIGAEKVAAKEFEDTKYFEGCLPIEVMAERGERTLAFGPMKPVGLTNPKTGRWPYAVVQLRQEDRAKTAYNMVGFQTRMKWPEQKRVFALIPGLENAEFLRMGSVHRNTFIDAPRVLDDRLALKNKSNVHLAGQITGVEGYVESAACGLMLSWMLTGFDPTSLAEESALGSLYRHLRRPLEVKQFQPSNVVFSMFPALDLSEVENGPKKGRKGKRERYELIAERALSKLPALRDAVHADRVFVSANKMAERFLPAEVVAAARVVETAAPLETSAS